MDEEHAIAYAVNAIFDDEGVKLMSLPQTEMERATLASRIAEAYKNR